MRKVFALPIIIVMALSAVDSLLTGKSLAGFLLECVTRLFQSVALLIVAGIVIALIVFIVGSTILITGIHKDINADPGTISRTIRQKMEEEYGWRRILGSHRTAMALMKEVCRNIRDSKCADSYRTLRRRIRKQMAELWPPHIGPKPEDWRDEE